MIRPNADLKNNLNNSTFKFSIIFLNLTFFEYFVIFLSLSAALLSSDFLVLYACNYRFRRAKHQTFVDEC